MYTLSACVLTTDIRYVGVHDDQSNTWMYGAWWLIYG
jgi:hypothetical protein